jgi:hypothetical protein
MSLLAQYLTPNTDRGNATSLDQSLTQWFLVQELHVIGFLNSWQTRWGKQVQ